MRKGILLNATIIGVLLFFITLPIIIFGLTDLLAKINHCEISPSGWGDGICRDLYTLTFLAGLIGSITSPLGIGILALYLVGILGYTIISYFRSKKKGHLYSPFSTGVLTSTIAFFLISGIVAGLIVARRWYYTSFISACKGLPKLVSQTSLQNGLITIGTKPAYPDNRREEYKIQLVSPNGELDEIPLELKAAKTPSWSADGRSIVFAAESKSNGLWGLYSIDESLSLRGPIIENNLEMAEPAWSPDGNSLIFQRWEKEDPNPKTQLYKINLKGENIVQLTDQGDFNGKAKFSPDGSQIVFVSDRNNGEDLYIMQADGSEIQRLTYHPKDDTDPYWSPNGKWIVFSSGRNSSLTRKNYDLYVMEVDGSNQCQLTSGDNLELRPSWSPDGTWIVYVERIQGKVYRARPDGSEFFEVPIPEGIEALSLDWGIQP